MIILSIIDVEPSSLAFSAYAALSSGPASTTSCSKAAEYGIIGLPPPCSLRYAWIFGSHGFFLSMYYWWPILTRYIMGLEVKKRCLFNNSISLALQTPSLTSLPASSISLTLKIKAYSSSSFFLSLFLFKRFSMSGITFSICYLSFAHNSKLIVSISLIGSISPSLWTTSSSGNARTTW